LVPPTVRTKARFMNVHRLVLRFRIDAQVMLPPPDS
jgi:hypothetical protein